MLFISIILISLTIIWIINASQLDRIVLHNDVVSAEGIVHPSYVTYYGFETFVNSHRHTGASQMANTCINTKLEVGLEMDILGIYCDIYPP